MADPYASVGPMGSFAGLSLWLVPASDADSSTPQHSVLKHEMGALRSANAGSPAFEPHATLLAGLKGEDGWTAGKIWPVFKDGLQKWRKEQNEAAESAEGKEKWMEVGLRDVTTRGFYWQCILLALNPDPALLRLNSIMRMLFSLESQPAYFPHVSLLYADLSSTQAQTQIDALQTNGVFSRTPNRIRFGSRESIESVKFDAVELWDSNGPVEEWKRLERAELFE